MGWSTARIWLRCATTCATLRSRLRRSICTVTRPSEHARSARRLRRAGNPDLAPDRTDPSPIRSRQPVRRRRGGHRWRLLCASGLNAGGPSDQKRLTCKIFRSLRAPHIARAQTCGSCRVGEPGKSRALRPIVPRRRFACGRWRTTRGHRKGSWGKSLNATWLPSPTVSPSGSPEHPSLTPIQTHRPAKSLAKVEPCFEPRPKKRDVSIGRTSSFRISCVKP